MGRASSGPRARRGSLARAIETKVVLALRGMDSLVRMCDERPTQQPPPQDEHRALRMGGDPEPLGA